MTFPYLLLTPGPTLEPCPLHQREDFEWLYGIGSPYWESHPLAKHEKCRCHIRQVSRMEFERIQRDGVRISTGEPVTLNGVPTGHILFNMVPLRGVR